eukprot:383307-Prymnesium_polylepis.1
MCLPPAPNCPTGTKWRVSRHHGASGAKGSRMRPLGHLDADPLSCSPTKRRAEAEVEKVGCNHNRGGPSFFTAVLLLSECSRSAPKKEVNGPYRASSASNTSLRRRTRGSSGESPRLVWSGR